MKVTILGSSGFIGSNLRAAFKKNAQCELYLPSRGDLDLSANLGHVIYCIGLTADFRKKPFETVDAHICFLNKLLSTAKFESLTYLSSTRVYIHSNKDTAHEEEEITVKVCESDDLYNLTKLTGERLCLSSGKQVKIIRLSNIVGPDINSDNFLSYALKSIIEHKSLELGSHLSSSKDYLFIDEATDMIMNISLYGREKIYNLGAGSNTTTKSILDEISKYIAFKLVGAKDASVNHFPRLSISKIEKEFNFKSTPITNKIFEILKINKHV